MSKADDSPILESPILESPAVGSPSPDRAILDRTDGAPHDAVGAAVNGADVDAPPPVLDPARRPTVIVDNLHVTYRVLTTGKSAQGGKLRPWARSLKRVKEIHAVRGVSFATYEGEIVGVIGHNGSGKSTLMRTVAGLQKPTKGMVYADGEPALLGVNAALIPQLSGERNVHLGGLAIGLTAQEIAEKRDEIVEFSGLGEFIDLPMKTYSSGMQQRLKFAISTAVVPHVLIVDEALATGDKDFRKRSEARIRGMQEHAGTVFLVSHQMTSIRKNCNRVIWLDQGLIRADGAPDDVIALYENGDPDDD
ncbi:MAG: teichoic acid transporter ATP-binding protein [Frankiales bacterium]|nr:teichoic acid transporter ATP-binding protein [Frankiales bacterium]